MSSAIAETIHPTTVATVQGSHELGQQVMALRYDLVVEVLQGMFVEACRQAEADADRGRPRLAGELDNLRLSLAGAVGSAQSLSAFCRPQIEAEKALPVQEPAQHTGWRSEVYTQYDSDPRPYWSAAYAEYPPHPSAAYRGGEPELWQHRFLEPVFTSAQALAPANLPFTDAMFRAFFEAVEPGAWDTALESQREGARQELTRALRAFLAAARVQPAQPSE